MTDVAAILTMVQSVGNFQPLIKEALEQIKVYKDEWQTICNFIVTDTVDVKSRIYKGFIEKGIPADHALALTVNTVDNLSKAIRSKASK